MNEVWSTYPLKLYNKLQYLFKEKTYRIQYNTLFSNPSLFKSSNLMHFWYVMLGRYSLSCVWITRITHISHIRSVDCNFITLLGFVNFGLENTLQ